MTDHLDPPATTTSEVEGRGGGDMEMIELELELQNRGVQASLPSLLKFASLQAIRRSIEWWDGKPGAGPGVLVGVIRKGGILEPAPSTHDDYWHDVAAWLRENFPELIDADGWPNPGATNAVVMLHYRHGKGSLTVAKHGRQIRKAAADYDKRFPLAPIPAAATPLAEDSRLHPSPGGCPAGGQTSFEGSGSDG